MSQRAVVSLTGEEEQTFGSGRGRVRANTDWSSARR
jgi:hypothetical protein